MTDYEQENKKVMSYIGRIFVVWSRIEFMCHEVLALLLKVDIHTARSINVPIISFDARWDILKSISKSKIEDPEILDEFDTLLGRVIEASIIRNRIAHSTWLETGEGRLIAYRFKPNEQ